MQRNFNEINRERTRANNMRLVFYSLQRESSGVRPHEEKEIQVKTPMVE